MYSTSVPPARPRPTAPARNDIPDGILSYYQSEDAGQVYTPPSPPPPPPPVEIETSNNVVPRSHRRQMSAASSLSEYSPNTDEESDSKFFQLPVSASPVAQKQRASLPSSTHTGVRKRRSLPLEGETERRRLAIVDTNSSDHGHGTARIDTIHSRRGINRAMHGLALVAPSDVHPTIYNHLTPPATAPLRVERNAATHDISHQRSTSDVATSAVAGIDRSTGHRQKSSRQIVIIGTNDGNTPSISPVINQQQSLDAFKVPIFQLPQSRSSSPGALSHSEMLDSHTASSRYGRSVKEDNLLPVQDPVVAPVASTARPPSRSPSPTKVTARTSSLGAESASTVASSSGSSYPSLPFTPEEPSSYLHYQPGIHAIAGPLPPPPRAVFNIVPGAAPPPRPPRLNSPPPSRNRRRDVESVKQALQFPDSLISSLSAKISSGSLSDVHSNSSRSTVSDRSEIKLPRSSPMSAASDQLPPITNTTHIREGAFPPSALPTDSPLVNSKRTEIMDDLVADVGNAINDVGLMSTSDVPPPTVIEPPRPSEESRTGITRGNSWVNIGQEDIPEVHTLSDEGGAMSVESHRGPINPFRRASSRSPPKTSKEMIADSSPLANQRHVRTRLGASLKRFSSLPRTPSRKTEKRLSASSHSSYTSSISTVSTAPPPPLPISISTAPPDVPSVPRTPPPVQKIISPWPSAMFYSEVLAKKTALERSLGYAAKINELYIHDCGLGDFLMERRPGGTRTRKNTTSMPYGPRGPSTAPSSFQPRHISHSSVESEATFPRRADTTTATDLGYRPSVDTSPPHGPPPLPYPSLALSPLTSSLSSTNTSLSSASSAPSARFLVSPKATKPSAGFFSSLGRKATMKSKDSSGAPLSSTQPARLQKVPAKPAAPNPRIINISNPPTIPGGPRTAPSRVSRSQTIMLPKSAPASSDSHRSNRRPSLFSNRREVSPTTSGESTSKFEEDPEFVSQIDKLADLLQQADRKVLEGYLRRAGSDLNAIGQYLDDEKNGILRLD